MVKLRFKGLRSLKLSGLRALGNMSISFSQSRSKNQKGRMSVHEIPLLEVIFVSLTENSSVTTNDTQGP